MRVQRADWEYKVVPLSSDWGRKVAAEKFGEELVSRFPIFSKGPRKGLTKGYLCWIKCSVGGWSRSCPLFDGKAGVLKPGSYGWEIRLVHPDADKQHHSRVALWSWNGGSPRVDHIQSPDDANKLYGDVGDNPRYA